MFSRKSYLIVILIWLASYSSGHAQSSPAAVHARAYYVQADGNDEGDGSIAAPWRTIRRVNAVVLHPGDSVFFRGGQTFEGTLELNASKTGDARHPVTVGSYGTGPAIIESGDSAAVILYLSKYLSLRNLQLKGTGRKNGNIKNGIAMIQCNHLRLERLDISGFQKSGLMIYASTDIDVSHVFVHDNGSAGITVEGEGSKKSSRNIRILDCRADNNPGDPTNLTNHSGNGIVVGHCTAVLIDRCSATNNGWDMPRIGNGPVGIWCYEADSVTIQNCLSYRNKTSVGGADGGGFDLDGGVTNSLIQYCFSYENQGSGYCIFQYWGASPWYHNIIRYNITEDDGTVSDSRAGIYIWNSSGDKNQFYDCICYNNTVYNTKEAALSFSEKSERKNFRFYNNIFIGADSLIKGNKGGDVFLGNDWWSLARQFNADGMANFTQWMEKYHLETISGKTVGFSINPGFKNPGNCTLTTSTNLSLYDHYKIPSGSLLRNSGIDLGRTYGMETGGKDFNHQKAPAKGIGASF
jgi:hypothetical protein